MILSDHDVNDINIYNLMQAGQELERNFGGKAANLVKSCGKSATYLVALITCHFPGIPYFTCFMMLLVTIVLHLNLFF